MRTRGEKNQVEFLTETLHRYHYIGAGREDGKEGGEQCAIIYNPTVVRLHNQETFWLSDTPDIPSKGYDPYPRMCTHGTFEEIATKKIFHIFNTHMPLPLNFSGKKKSIAIVLDRIKPHLQSPIILTADFNSTPKSPVWQSILSAGFKKPPHIGRTARILRVPAFCFDAVFVNNYCSVDSYRKITHHHPFLFPSDHYGIASEINLL